ncbi:MULTISPECIES: permease [unclassified Dinoroseobacter]|uniref:permease n=1 Tax=unclassified Dinoroseobacter TaxID=2620028 RepID=UPI003C79BAC2
MAETSTQPPKLRAPAPRRRLPRPDPALSLIALALLALALLDRAALRPVIENTLGSFGHTLIFILFAIGSVAYLRATGATTLLAKAFQGNETRMILMAAAFGGLSPFCSCEVIPFVAALLAVGAPLSAVMAFWLASPLMDPAMFFITSGALGIEFALGKTVAAIALGMMGGFSVKLLAGTALYADPLKSAPKLSCCGSCGPAELEGKPVWKFWTEAPRRQEFREVAVQNTLFLGKWLLLAYVLESLMLRYIPSEMIAGVLGGDGVGPILIASLVGAPAYLNGYAAVPLVAGLLEQGMSPGAAMSFVIAGGVSCIPAAVAVWALVKPRVFASYLGFSVTGAILAGLVWNMVA